jgi:hypothetical protein
VDVSHLARVLRAAADACDEIAAEATAAHADWIDQRQSQLGPRRHCRAVQRLIAAGSKEAARVGRRQLLSQVAHAEELGKSATKPSGAKSSIADELRAELRLVGASR